MVTRIARPPKDLDSFLGRKWLETLTRQGEDLSALVGLTFLLVTIDPSLPNARALAGSSDILLTDSGVGGTISLSLTTSGVVSGTYTKVTVDSKGRVTVGATASSTDITEGLKLFFTDARARAALSGTANQIVYDSGTGVIGAVQNIHTGASPSFVTVLLSGLTSGRVVFATTSGQLTDDADLTFNGTTLSSTQFSGRLLPRSATVASAAAPAINTDTTDIFTITALAADITSMTTNLTGTPLEGQRLTVRFLDDGTARAIAWGASFASRGATLPTTTVISKYLYVELIWNAATTTWDCISTAQEV